MLAAMTGKNGGDERGQWLLNLALGRETPLS